MFERAYALTVRKGCYEAYKKSHDELWQGVADILDQNNISMIIYYYEPTLFLYQVAPDEQSFKNYESTDINLKWNTYMAEYLETNPDGSIKIDPVSEAFMWGIFKAKSLLK